MIKINLLLIYNMLLKTKLMFLSIIVICACMLQIILHKKTYEGFTQFISDENKLSFNQFDRKYNSINDCKANNDSFDIAQYVEVYISDDEKGKLISENTIDEAQFDEEMDYDIRWTSGKVINKNGDIYSIELVDKTVLSNVNIDRIKNHHQNACNVCGNNDNECTEDCMDPINVGGHCLPVKTGKNGKDEDILYKVCPRICRNDSVNITDLACETDNCCRGCGFSVFEVSDDNDSVKKLTKIPYEMSDYNIDPTYIYADEMAKESKRLNDNIERKSGDDTSASPTSKPQTDDTNEDTVIEETSNVVNALTDTENCWLGPTGHNDFMYCGPTPFSF